MTHLKLLSILFAPVLISFVLLTIIITLWQLLINRLRRWPIFPIFNIRLETSKSIYVRILFCFFYCLFFCVTNLFGFFFHSWVFAPEWFLGLMATGDQLKNFKIVFVVDDSPFPFCFSCVAKLAGVTRIWFYLHNSGISWLVHYVKDFLNCNAFINST